jgi:sister chromatid cohesion protein PDS5
MLSEGLPNVAEEELVAHIAVLAEIARDRPSAFETKSEDIMGFIVKQVLMKPCLLDNEVRLLK